MPRYQQLVEDPGEAGPEPMARTGIKVILGWEPILHSHIQPQGPLPSPHSRALAPCIPSHPCCDLDCFTSVALHCIVLQMEGWKVRSLCHLPSWPQLAMVERGRPRLGAQATSRTQSEWPFKAGPCCAHCPLAASSCHTCATFPNHSSATAAIESL